MPSPDHFLSIAGTASDVAAVRSLFADYQRSLDVDLCFQGFAGELAGLPGQYAGPRGVLLLARGPGSGAEPGPPLGCVAARPLSGTVCEMKRLYTVPEARGTGLGRALVTRVVQEAASRGYTEIRLDTLPGMTEAIALYRRMGFTQIDPYYATPIGGTLFFARSLASAARPRPGAV